MVRSTDRILTTHVGSLVRPDDLVALLRDRGDEGPLDDAEYHQVLRRSVHDVVARQADVGIDLVSDGEFGKTVSWSRYILERLGGFEDRPDPADADADPDRLLGPRTDVELFRDFYVEYNKTQGFEGKRRNCVCVGPITYAGTAALTRDITNMVDAVDAANAAGGDVAGFLPVVAPASVAYERKDEHYATEEEYVFATAEALAVEYRSIVDAGLVVQVDDAHLPMMHDKMIPPATPAEFDRWARLRVDALNHALEGLPVDRTRYHICWGSFNSPHVGDVPFRDIAQLVLSVNVGGYAIEMANPRHEHEWQVWRDLDLPDDRVLIPGVVAHTTNVVEHPDLVAERIIRLAGIVGRERVIAGTDCGFAQGPFVRRVHPSIMWAKLEALVEGARRATDQLWR